MKRASFLPASAIIAMAVLLSVVGSATAAPSVGFRPPAIPLVVHDPYFSIWSFSDHLTDEESVHWTGAPQPLRSLVRVDGKPYRLMGTKPEEIAPMWLMRSQVLPTRTIYEYATDEVSLTLTFITPTLPDDLDILARPVTYIVWEVSSRDYENHRVEVYFEVAPEIAVNTQDQPVEWSAVDVEGLRVLRVGTLEQPVLQRQGDRVRIDWGHAYLAVEDNPVIELAPCDGEAARSVFARRGRLPMARAEQNGLSPEDGAPVLAATFAMGNAGTKPVSCRAMLAYDDEYSIRYFGSDLRPYWRRYGMDAAVLLSRAADEFEELEKRCEDFDELFLKDMRLVGGDEYALITALAYRQAIAANKLCADADGAPLLFPKENASNGCIGTVDVFYPMMPICYLFSPALAKAVVVPVLDYAASDRWTFPYAPHDLGRYPHATGQVYGGGEISDERQMPVEESANMILLVAGIVQTEGTPQFANRYWPLLQQWANYLKEKGYDPENQLCTDDFAGHLAHNANLSAKAICALAAFGWMHERRGSVEAAEEWRQLATSYVDRWLEEADDETHFRLAFDKPGTWSQKYNIVWDRILNLGLWPTSALRKEMDHYFEVQNEFGLPLDSRSTYTKLDWIFWTACLTGERPDQDRLIHPVLRFLNESPDRVPMSDWYFTDTAKVRGFRARPVVGGVFMPVLTHRALWGKWSGRGENFEGDWAPIPIRPTNALSPTSEHSPTKWRVMFEKPASGWETTDFDDSGWTVAEGGFGTKQNRPPNMSIGTDWKDTPIWLHREFELESVPESDVRLRAKWSAPCTIYVNGVLAAQLSGDTRGYEEIKLQQEALDTLAGGKNQLAVRCEVRNGQRARNFIDVGLVELGPQQ